MATRPILLGALVLTAMSVLLSSGVYAQSYTITRVDGPQPYTSTINDGELLLLGPVNSVLTSWQELPFPFRFFGRTVTGYAVSDNGYLTFDPDATLSIGSNVGWGTSTPPNNAIYAFWEELELLGNAPEYRQQVRSITVGTAPNRVHVVMWMGVMSRATSGGEIHVGVAIKEAGGFAIVQTQRSGTAVYAGAIGAENHDGTVSVWVEGSPNLNIPPMWTGDEDDVTYEFTSMEEETDLRLLQILAPDLLHVSGEYPVGVIVRNDGGRVVNSAAIRVAYEGTTDTLILPEPLASNMRDTLWLDQPHQAGEAGTGRAITAQVVTVNGALDDHPEDDSLQHTTWFNRGASVPRTPLVEKFTGAWCGFCADGSRILVEVAEREPDAIYMAHHIGGLDSMKTDEGVALGRAFRSGTPMAMFDRTLLPELARVPIDRSNDSWLKAVRLRSGEGAVATLNIEPVVYWATNRIGARVSVRFVDDVVPADYRVHVVIVEDSVSGVGPGFDQRNYYSGDDQYPGHPLYDEDPWIEGFQHRFVARYLPTGTWGDSLSLPSRPRVGEVYELTVDQFVDFGVDVTNVSIVAFITRHHPEDARERPVLNAAQTPALAAVSVREQPMSSSLMAFPNPAREIVTLSGARGHVRISDLLGTSRYSSVAVEGLPLSVDVSSWPTGMYLVVHDGAALTIRVVR